MTKLPAFKVQATYTDGRIETSPRIAFRSIAANDAVVQRKRPDVLRAIVIEA